MKSRASLLTPDGQTGPPGVPSKTQTVPPLGPAWLSRPGAGGGGRAAGPGLTRRVTPALQTRIHL